MAADGEVQYHVLPRDTDVDPAKSEFTTSISLRPKQDAGQTHIAQTRSVFSLSLLRLDDWWSLEFLGLSASAAILVAIICTLHRYDDQPQPTWTLVSLNTLVSWLSTVAKASVLIPISRGLSQLKWLWFMKDEQAIEDLRTFDAASRGLTGSLLFLLERPGRHFAGVAALTTILALGFDPFLQNLIHYVPRSVANATVPAYVTNASSYGSNGIPMSASQLGASYLFWVDPVMKANVYNSLLNTDAAQPWALPQFVCTSGNCTWDPIATLAVRPDCKSFASLLRKQCTRLTQSEETCELAVLDDEPRLLYNSWPSATDIVMNLQTSNTSLVHDNGPLRAVQMVMAKGSNDNLTALAYGDGISNSSTIIATECIFEICVQSLRLSVVDGAYTERIIDWWCDSSLLNMTKDWTSLHPDSPTGWRRLELRPSWGPDHGMHLGDTFGISSSSLSSLHDFLRSIFSGNVSVSSPAFIVSSDDTMYAGQDILGSIFFGNLSGCADAHDHLKCAADNAAKAMTKTFRDSARVAYGTADAQMAAGETLIILNYVQIQWSWISLPAVIWFLALVTCIGTAWMTRNTRLPSWREDILPLLFLYREEEKQETAAGLHASDGKMSEHLADLGEQIKVRLGTSGNRWRLT